MSSTPYDRARRVKRPPGDLPAWVHDAPHSVDRRLPPWARRSHPIVRRHLGVFWKIMPPDPAGIARIVLAQLLYLALSLPVPFLLTILMPTVTVSLVMLPIGLYVYAGVLLRIGALAAAHLADERRSDSLDLLRVTPIPLSQILYSKAAAAIWRQIENLTFLVIGAALFSLPLLIIQFDSAIGATAHPLAMRLAVAAGLIVSVVRIPLEAVMVACIGLLVGASSRWRAPAALTTGMLSAADVASLNLMRLLPADPAGVVVIELILPLLLPIVISAISLRAAAASIDR
ncbi:MAG: hypothetical protein ACUVS2_01705 [Candidatus Flexifilum sp.]